MRSDRRGNRVKIARCRRTPNSRFLRRIALARLRPDLRATSRRRLPHRSRRLGRRPSSVSTTSIGLRYVRAGQASIVDRYARPVACSSPRHFAVDSHQTARATTDRWTSIQLHKLLSSAPAPGQALSARSREPRQGVGASLRPSTGSRGENRGAAQPGSHKGQLRRSLCHIVGLDLDQALTLHRMRPKERWRSWTPRHDVPTQVTAGPSRCRDLRQTPKEPGETEHRSCRTKSSTDRCTEFVDDFTVMSPANNPTSTAPTRSPVLNQVAVQPTTRPGSAP